MTAGSGRGRAARPARGAGTARAVAGRVLLRVAEDGAWAAAAIDGEARRARLSARDAALAAQIVYGALRVLPALDLAVDAELTGDPRRVDALARAALRAATFQLLHLSRVPPHAVIDGAVEWVRTARGAGLAALVNAVLRKVAGARPAEPRLPARVVVPPWVETVFEDSLGRERAEALLARGDDAPPLGLRVREDVDLDSLASRVREERPRASVAPGSLAPRALLLQRAGDPRALRTFAEGAFAVQEEGSQLVALAVGAQPGDRVADVCAGHGGKTTWLLERVGVRGHVTALDRDGRKLARIAAEVTRLRLDARALDVRVADVAQGVDDLAGRYDRVLVDAPCSGLGTLARRPELLFRLGPGDLARLAELQLAIATGAAALVRPGGVFVYAVCSLARAEGAGVADRVERAVPQLKRLRVSEPGLPATDDDGVMRIGPWLGAGSPSRPDGYQIVRWRRLG